MTENTEQQQQPELQVADIQFAIAAIDHACTEGAYKGWDIINQVYARRARLVAFVNAVAPTEQPAEEAFEEAPKKTAAKKSAKK